MRDRRHLPLILLSVATTLALGIVLRWQFAGWSAWGAGLDLRRAHSHLGYYGFLFPMSWVFLRRSDAWIPGERCVAGYFGLVAASTLGFLFQGYGPLAIASSTGILSVWLAFAWKNRKQAGLLTPSWLAVIPWATLLGSLLIVPIAILTRSQPIVAQQIARVFLTMLLLGVFAPSVLHRLAAPAPKAWIWILNVGVGAIGVSDLIQHPLLPLGIAGAGAWIVWSFRGSFWPFPSSASLSNPGAKDRLVRDSWLALGAGLALLGFGILPHGRAVSIAGIHFAFLGPLLISFSRLELGLRPARWQDRGYFLSLTGMCAAIGLQDFSPAYYLELQRMAAVFGLSTAVFFGAACTSLIARRIRSGHSLPLRSAPNRS